jgi:hypothetical protein
VSAHRTARSFAALFHKFTRTSQTSPHAAPQRRQSSTRQICVILKPMTVAPNAGYLCEQHSEEDLSALDRVCSTKSSCLLHLARNVMGSPALQHGRPVPASKRPALSGHGPSTARECMTRHSAVHFRAVPWNVHCAS